MRNEITVEQLKALGEQLGAAVKAGLTTTTDYLLMAFPWAHHIVGQKHDVMDIRSIQFDQTVEAYYGLVVQNWLQPYLQLHANLTERGCTTEEEKYEFGNDAYVWACANNDIQVDAKSSRSSGVLDDLMRQFGMDPNAPTQVVVKAIVLETQSRTFIIVLNKRSGRWTLHIRRVWASLTEIKQKDHAFSLDAYVDRTDLTLDDVIKLASTAVNEFGDDYPDVTFPKRPFLSAYLKTNMVAREDASPLGLRYGDARDPGYIVSFTEDETLPVVKDAVHANYGDLSYVAYNLASAIDVLSDE